MSTRGLPSRFKFCFCCPRLLPSLKEVSLLQQHETPDCLADSLLYTQRQPSQSTIGVRLLCVQHSLSLTSCVTSEPQAPLL